MNGTFGFLIYAVIVLALTGWGCYEFHEKLLTEESFSAMVRNVGLVVAGVIAIGLAVWRSAVAEKQAATAEQQIVLAEQQAASTRANLLNEQYQRAVELLSHKESYIRIGGMHAIRNLAVRNPQFSENALTMLRAYQEVGGIRETQQRELTHNEESRVAERAIDDIVVAQLSRGVDDRTFYDKATKAPNGLDSGARGS